MTNAPSGGAKAPSPGTNQPKPNSNPDVNEPSNVRPPSKPTPDSPPDTQEADKGAGETEDMETTGN